MKFRSYGELDLGAKAQVRPRSWTKILTESWPSAGPSPRVYLVNGIQQRFNPPHPESARYRYRIQQQRAEISFSARGNRFSILRAQLPSPERFTISPSILEPKTQLT